MIANQVAISLQNGRMVETLEKKTTTDGLTGLTNHRTFQERFSAMLGRAECHQMYVSFLLRPAEAKRMPGAISAPCILRRAEHLAPTGGH